MKKSFKTIILVVLGILISITCTVVAETIIESKNVTYSNTVSGGSYADVQDAIDELYARARYVGEKYTEEILHGADPVLGKDMIPIYLDGKGNVYYANTNTQWYSYEEKRWANAVMLTDTGKNKNYKTGDKIDENDIRAYFVWIPRYAYKLWNLAKQDAQTAGNTLTDATYDTSTSKASNNARIIDVVFGTKSYFDSGAGTSLQAKSLTWSNQTGKFSEPEGLVVGDYLQHPAFTFGSTELNGIWVGKFETTGNTNNITVKPGQVSWRGQTIDTFFRTYMDYSADLKSHMMKNTEWGAAAYLSHSAYGKGAEININNAQDYKTGYSAAPDTDQSSYQGTFAASTDATKTQPWNTATGYLASTTGNITGIYDMAGGAWEYVAATMDGQQSGDASGMKESVASYAKQGYIDLYDSASTWNGYSKRILGDATGEMGPFYSYKDKDGNARNHNSWYADSSGFVDSPYPWFNRGGVFGDGVLAGQFNFIRYTGAAGGGDGSRLVLAPLSAAGD